MIITMYPLVLMIGIMTIITTITEQELLQCAVSYMIYVAAGFVT